MSQGEDVDPVEHAIVAASKLPTGMYVVLTSDLDGNLREHIGVSPREMRGLFRGSAFRERSYPVPNIESCQPERQEDGTWAIRLVCSDRIERRFTTRKPISPRRVRTLGTKLRFIVLERDGFACQYCGRKAPDVELEVDHRVALAKGGPDTPDNLVTACWDCNRGKRDR